MKELKTKFDDRLIFEKSVPGVRGIRFDMEGSVSVEERMKALGLSDEILNDSAPMLPEVAENEVIRHYINLSGLNFCVDNGFYPLGSCTMKYNPKINDVTSSLPGFVKAHPFSEDENAQGILEMIYNLSSYLAEIVGMDVVSLQPLAGASGELTGAYIMKKYHEDNNTGLTKVIIPDSAHGTNPATVVMAGFEVLEIPSNKEGGMDVAAIEEAVNQGGIAGLMVTNPNTLGIFDKNIRRIAEIIHNAGGLLYYDGANENAIMGRSKAGTMGFDIVHLNLHKTFSTPHGGGGPGGGAVGVKKHLGKYLPKPMPIFENNVYRMNYDMPDSIGKVHSFWGNFRVLVMAYTYILILGAKGIKNASETAVLNANYLLERLKERFDPPYKGRCMHEFVLSGKFLEKHGVHTLDLAKALIDEGYHPPTVYFPLIVEEALMIEPTETENKKTLDDFADALIRIVDRAVEGEDFHSRPETTPVTRLDETSAARKPDICFSGMCC
jgi:glycine dehydrogenase subunit 2